MAEVITIIPPDPSRTSLRVAVLAEGYVAGQRDQFVADAASIFHAITEQPMWSQYADRWDLVGVWAESPGGGMIYGTVFGGGTHVSADRMTVLNGMPALGLGAVAAIIVLVNSDAFAGTSGGYFLNVTRNPASQEIARHEFGHLWGNLADEYQTGNNEGDAPFYPNVDFPQNIASPKWNDLIAAGKIGAPAMGDDGKWIHPGSCKMRDLGVPFCAVCEKVQVDVLRSRLGIAEPAPDPIPDPIQEPPTPDPAPLPQPEPTPDPEPPVVAAPVTMPIPLTLSALKSELQTDPASIGYSAALTNRDDTLAAALINVPRYDAQKTGKFISARTLLGIGPIGVSILEKFEGLAASGPDAGTRATAKWTLKFLNVETGIDVGNPVALATVEALKAAGVFTQAERDLLFGLCTVQISRAEQLFGVPLISVNQVSAALNS